MRKIRKYGGVALVVALATCGGNSPTAPPVKRAMIAQPSQVTGENVTLVNLVVEARQTGTCTSSGTMIYHGKAGQSWVFNGFEIYYWTKSDHIIRGHFKSEDPATIEEARDSISLPCPNGSNDPREQVCWSWDSLYLDESIITCAPVIFTTPAGAALVR